MITREEMTKINNINAKNNYGLTNDMLKNLIDEHKKARQENNTHAMELIEYKLTDINFHRECSLLQKGEYDEIIKKL
ncbi:hypothetical protein [Clostridium sp.]|uniref:hypothetical protein n=1 Tax=Clostridium sp. TaxID=1506 RepID=UPI00263928E8|nr:hypothetical protein [Clostridium sp.]